MNKEKADERITRVINEMREEYVQGTVLNVEVPPLVNKKTGEIIGNAVILYLSPKYDYTEDFLKLWKDKFGADEFSVSAYNVLEGMNSLVKVKFTIRYKRI